MREDFYAERTVGCCQPRGEDWGQLLESERVAFRDRSSGLVTALDVLEHIEDDETMLREVQRVLRPGGSLLAPVCVALLALAGAPRT